MQKIAIIALIVFVLSACTKHEAQYITNKGAIFGTYYYMVYETPEGENLQTEIDELLHTFNGSLSTYYKESVISKINSNTPVVPDSFFITVFNRALEISEITHGAFDPTVAPLVNAWGFGFTKKEQVTPELIDSIKAFTGYHLINIEDGKIVKKDERVMLDYSAIAKGYGVDVVGNFLKEKGCENFMVDIGGEVVAQGVNKEGNIWRIGINQPNDNEYTSQSKLQAIVNLENKAIATSGDYRNFYIENGKKYAHTIDPKTGYPINHNILSASVIADDCITADAYATAFMVMGVEKSIEMVKQIDEVEVYLISSGADGEFKVTATEGFKKYLQE